jgi:hypothetical protein
MSPSGCHRPRDDRRQAPYLASSSPTKTPSSMGSCAQAIWYILTETRLNNHAYYSIQVAQLSLKQTEDNLKEP